MKPLILALALAPFLLCSNAHASTYKYPNSMKRTCHIVPVFFLFPQNVCTPEFFETSSTHEDAPTPTVTTRECGRHEHHEHHHGKN